MLNFNVITRLFLLLALTQCSSPTKPKEKVTGIKVPTEWIEKVRKYDYKHDNLPILKQFEEFIAPDTLAGASESPHLNQGVLGDIQPGMLNPIFVNLDDDPADELIGIFGYTRREPTLAVFKLINNSWYLLYRESFFVFNEDPELQVANSFSTNKAFYIRCLYDRGSGILRNSYRFYKLVNNKVHPCLEITNEANINGWGLNLNQEVSTKFQINSANADEIWVNYRYNFFPGPGREIAGPEDMNMSFAKGEKSVIYIWDAKTLTYQPELHNLSEELSKDQISCFNTFGNDALFIKAFDTEIKENLRTAPAEQRKYLQIHLAFLKNKKKGLGLTQEMDETVQVGGLKFYSPKNKQ